MSDRLKCRRQQLLLGVASQVTQRAVDLEPATVEIDERHPNRRKFIGAAEALLAFAQGPFEEFACGDIFVRYHRAGMLARQWRHAHDEPALLTWRMAGI